VAEDAITGVQAAKAAGACCLGLTTIFDGETLRRAGADLIARDFTELELMVHYGRALTQLVRRITGHPGFRGEQLVLRLPWTLSNSSDSPALRKEVSDPRQINGTCCATSPQSGAKVPSVT
jgi:hypothetical protein